MSGDKRKISADLKQMGAFFCNFSCIAQEKLHMIYCLHTGSFR